MTRRYHPAMLVVAITFLALLFAVGLRSAPAVLMQPLELHFGWTAPPSPSPPRSVFCSTDLWGRSRRR